ncbi:hypothetical protein [Aporhodopirellula aestuarii]|uniref:Uncharacterized protein n=1 Tax=Aporhodopirellula aestuarii TaxID=2950107 RepID=A0ABT0U0U3_9BACT|nr:hypothetical protein [Aporhodopirellula aestuarii]MCM2370498.1 hypothetical protein [Aporhodopirellula aestuarii]
MAKFYVQSGTFRRVVAADSSRKAALWAVHEVMQQILPTEEGSVSRLGNTPAAQSQHERDEAPVQNMTVLSGVVRVNERGFDRHDASELPTMEVIGEWNQMAMTLERLQQLLDGSRPNAGTRHDRITGDDSANKRFSDDQFSEDLAA